MLPGDCLVYFSCVCDCGSRSGHFFFFIWTLLTVALCESCRLMLLSDIPISVACAFPVSKERPKSKMSANFQVGSRRALRLILHC